MNNVYSIRKNISIQFSCKRIKSLTLFNIKVETFFYSDFQVPHRKLPAKFTCVVGFDDLRLSGILVVVEYEYDVPPLICYAQPWSGWRTIRSSEVLRTIWATHTSCRPRLRWCHVRRQPQQCYGWLDRLILGHATGTIGATYGLNMSTVVLAPSSVPAFFGHFLRLYSSAKGSSKTNLNGKLVELHFLLLALNKTNFNE